MSSNWTRAVILISLTLAAGVARAAADECPLVPRPKVYRDQGRTLALGATGQALSRMLDEQPRCCKRASRSAILSSVDYLRENLGINLSQGKKVSCTYSLRNQQCAKEKCPYYDKTQS